ncbi:D-alanyl-D-alanine carboxypeptidase [Salaquimonas pukyongi]|uniref:serine hydrolase n=1 Tax=Salaquimonas pukyongi TaxID=2712698 RepID=UPI00096BA36F|nr:D-alanyl-D-alanine carboxypeptidase [Salaquimonas pukyongi]
MRTVFATLKRIHAPLLSAMLAILTALAVAIGPAQAKQDYAGIVMDAKTGKVLYSHKGTAKRYPASLTKMMTLYMLFEALDTGRVTKKTRIRFSRHAASMQPSKLGVKAGSSISVQQAIYALAIKSANDAAAAVGEHLGGTESKFAQMMTAKARSLGMKNTVFKNASGLPNSRQLTTARDMALLGIALREHYPHYYRYFSTRSFKFGKRSYRNHNRLLGQIRGYDGIKTGYTRASGFNLVSSVEDKGRSIVAVVMGGRTGKSRNAQMAKLIRQYLPKASRGRDRIVVAKAGGGAGNVFASLLKLVKRAPLPEPSPREPDPAPVVTAYAAPTPAPSQVIGRSPDPLTTASVKPAAPVTSAAASEPIAIRESISGWHVQIGAMPSKHSALARLEKARSALPGLFDTVANYTETVESGGTTLYRARFAGFTSKDAAWGACSRLKKAKFDCLALKQ